MCQIYRLLYSIHLFTSGVRNVQRASTCGTLWRMSVIGRAILYMCLSCLSASQRSDFHVQKLLPTEWPSNSHAAHLSTIRLYGSRSVSVLRTQMYVLIKEKCNFLVILKELDCRQDACALERLRKITAALRLNIFRKTYTVIMCLKTKHMTLQIRQIEQENKLWLSFNHNLAVLKKLKTS